MNSKRNGTMMRAVGAVGLTGLLAACGTQVGNQVTEPFTPDNVYHADLAPLNATVQGAEAAHGGATARLEGNTLTVTIEADGLTPNQTHPQHIHGFTGTFAPNAVCPPEAAANDDPAGNPDVISLTEGAPYYGGVRVPLVTGNLGDEPMNFPEADAEGQINYSKTFTLTDAQLQEITPLFKMAIVLHGAVVNGTYEPTLPVACGTLVVGNVN